MLVWELSGEMMGKCVVYFRCVSSLCVLVCMCGFVFMVIFCSSVCVVLVLFRFR